MSTANIGINGFGRIGRLILRAAISRGTHVGVKGINDPSLTTAQMAYLLAYDSVHGQIRNTITIEDDLLIIDGHKIQTFSSKDPKDIPWGNLSCDYIIESSGIFTSTEKALQHIEHGGAKKVVLSAPPKDDTPMFVFGVNHKSYTHDMLVISNASCTTNCLAPLAHLIHEHFGIEEGLMTTIHSMTATQTVVDGTAHGEKNWRAGRCASLNIIPSTTGAAKAVGKVIPSLSGKLTGMAFRVPTANVSVVDLTVKLSTPTTYAEICQSIKDAAERETGPFALKDIIGFTDNDVVSQDFVGDARSCIFDAKAGIMLNSTFVKLVAWYDNEWAYSHRMLDLVEYIFSIDNGTIV